MITLENLNERPLSYSSIKEFSISPSHYISYLNRPRKVTPELTFGSALHCLLLEPSKFNERYIISRKFDLRKKEDKAEYEVLLSSAEQSKMTIIQQDTADELFQISSLVNNNQEFRDIIDCSSVEVEDRVEICGLPFIRIKDIVKGNQIIDIKTVQNGQVEEVIKDAFKYKYYLQAAVYGDGFGFYVVEKNAPYYNGYMPVSSDFIEYGKKTLDRLCTAFNYCLENPDNFSRSYDFWYEFDAIKPVVGLPKWIKLD